MLKRLLNFEKHDWKHLWFLFKTGIRNLLIMDYKEAKESYYWIKIHLTHDSAKIK